MNNKKIKRTPYGQWKYPHEPTVVPTPTGKITMQGLNYPVLGIDNLGNSQMMMPGNNYQFPGNEVLELPVYRFQNGGDFYNLQRALELGYTPDESGHLPSVDSETGNWLKSKQHPTAWMEALHGYQLNPEVYNNYIIRYNPEGYFGENQLQYVPMKKYGDKIKYQSGGNFNMRQGSGESDYTFWDGLGSFAFGTLQGAVGAIPGVGAVLSPALEAGRKGLQSLTGNKGKAEDDIIAGIGGIAGAIGTSIFTGNPMGALGGSEQGINKITNAFDKAQDFDKLPLFEKGGNMLKRKRTNFYQMGGDMGLTEYEGLSHEEGGLPIPGRNAEVEDGETMIDDYVFSDSLLVPGKKKTFAQESKAIKNRYNLRKGDPLSQEVVNDALRELMVLQEDLKKEMASEKLNEALELDPSILESMMQGVSSMPQNNPQEMPMGSENMMPMEGMSMMQNGGNLKKYQYGDLFDPTTEVKLKNNQGFDWTSNSLFSPSREITTSQRLNTIEPIQYNNSLGPITPIKSRNNQGFDGLNNFALLPPVEITAPTGQGINNETPSSENQDVVLSEFEQNMLPMRAIQGLNAVEPIANFIAAGAGRQPRLTKNQDFLPMYSRPAEMLLESSNNRALATGRNSLRDASPNQQSFLANTIATTSKVSEDIGRGIGDLRFKSDLENLKNKQKTDLTNIRNQTANNLLLDESDANRWNLALQGVQGFKEGMQQGLMDEMLMDSDLLKIGLSSTPNYRYDIDSKGGKRRIKRIYHNNKKQPTSTSKSKEN